MPGDCGGFLKLELRARGSQRSWNILAVCFVSLSLSFFFFVFIFLRDLNIIKTNRCCQSVRLVLILLLLIMIMISCDAVRGFCPLLSSWRNLTCGAVNCFSVLLTAHRTWSCPCSADSWCYETLTRHVPTSPLSSKGHFKKTSQCVSISVVPRSHPGGHYAKTATSRRESEAGRVCRHDECSRLLMGRAHSTDSVLGEQTRPHGSGFQACCSDVMSRGSAVAVEPCVRTAEERLECRGGPCTLIWLLSCGQVPCELLTVCSHSL